MTELEAIDVEYWRAIKHLTVWQAAFIVCNIEPWDEPISANAKPPKQVETMRGVLLTNIAHYETGIIYSSNGWSCKTQRPAQLSGLYFSRDALCQWSSHYFVNADRPLAFAQ